MQDVKLVFIYSRTKLEHVTFQHLVLYPYLICIVVYSCRRPAVVIYIHFFLSLATCL